ncbi:hypothetical protein ACLKA7_013600 [Drosophila subpalustris]
MKHTTKTNNESKTKETEEASSSSSNAKRIRVQGKPENYFNLCQLQGGANFDDMETEEESDKADDQSEMEYKNIIAKKAMERERQSRSRQEQLLGEKELPGVLRTLARVYDFQKCCMLDKPREAAVKPLPLVAIPQPEPPKLREVPVVPPALLPMTVDKQRESFQHPRPASQSITLSEYNRRNHDAKSMGKAGGEQELKTNMIRYNSMASNARQIPIPRHLSQAYPPGGNRLLRRRIIVVPSELLSLVSLHNVQMLLQECRFIPPSVMRRSNLRLLEEVIINRNHRGEQQQYRAIDNVTRLTSEDWAQVVAVFVLSPHTQFIGWPHKGDPAVICRQVCAFHIHFLGHPIYREVEALNLNILHLPEYDRSRDKEIIMDFWRKLDQHMDKNPLGLRLT